MKLQPGGLLSEQKSSETSQTGHWKRWSYFSKQSPSFDNWAIIQAVRTQQETRIPY